MNDLDESPPLTIAVRAAPAGLALLSPMTLAELQSFLNRLILVVVELVPATQLTRSGLSLDPEEQFLYPERVLEDDFLSSVIIALPSLLERTSLRAH